MGRKKLTKKTCPLCGIEKLRSEYYEYNAKGRKSKRMDSRCKSCSSEYCKPAKKRYFNRNREAIINRLKQWNKENKEHIKQIKYEYNKNGVLNLSMSYLNSGFKKLTGLDGNDHPELLLIYKNQLLLKRKINEKSKDAPDLSEIA